MSIWIWYTFYQSLIFILFVDILSLLFKAQVLLESDWWAALLKKCLPTVGVRIFWSFVLVHQMSYSILSIFFLVPFNIFVFVLRVEQFDDLFVCLMSSMKAANASNWQFFHFYNIKLVSFFSIEPLNWMNEQDWHIIGCWWEVCCFKAWM